MILGITGTDGAGKGTVVKYLKEKSFVHLSAREIWVEELKKQNRPINRNNMRLVANVMRGKYGNDFFIAHYLKKVEQEGLNDVIMESVRALAEVETLKKHGGILLAVDADQSVRYERVQKRRSETDQVTFGQFKAHEELEANDPDPHGMQKEQVIKRADYVISNDGTLEDLNIEIEKVLQKIKE